MNPPSFFLGQRLSTKGNRCTVRYVGQVQDKQGQWLGVEWDDPTRGKHSGTHEGIEYFTCRSNEPTAGSFIRPSATWDQPRSFIEALKSKYASTKGEGDVPYDPEIEIVRISGKTAEEVGFDKIARQQAQLHILRIVVLDDMLVQHQYKSEPKDLILKTCPSIRKLDLGRNLITSISEVTTICRQLERLEFLALSGNRFVDFTSLPEEHEPHVGCLDRLTTLEVDDTLLSIAEFDALLFHFPNLKQISASKNQLQSLDRCNFPRSLTSITLEGNEFTSLEDVAWLSKSCDQLQTLNLKNNRIESSSRKGSKGIPQLPLQLLELDLSYNKISTWEIINNLPSVCPGLKHLRISQNPLFESLTTADGKALTSADGYMLTIARLPNLETLNYSTVTEKERLNAETYYLSQIALQISQSPLQEEADVIARHPRYPDLCKEYGEPRIERKSDSEVDPNSLAARLLTCNFYFKGIPGEDNLPTREAPYSRELPKSLNIYAVLGLIGKHFGLLPMHLRLTWETGEKERVKPPPNTWIGVQEWDSSDDEAEDQGEGWREREVELVAGTRPLGTIVESAEVIIRVELRTQGEILGGRK